MVPHSLLRTVACVTALVACSACIPIRNDVSLNGTFPQMPVMQLNADEGFAIIGWGGLPDAMSESFLISSDAERNARGRWRSGEDMATCVRDAVSDSARPARMVEPDAIHPAAPGLFATQNALLTEDAVSNALRDAAASPTFAALNIRYAVLVGGSTQESDHWNSSGGGVPVAGFGHKKRTHIQADVWDLMTGRRLESFFTDAAGAVEVFSAGLVINTLNYAPTEATACKDMADKILNYLSVSIAAAE
jgi:hypothetical protein